jgi:hypothetical protein
MSGHKFFEIEIRDVNVVPFRSYKYKNKNKNNSKPLNKLATSLWAMNEIDKTYIHFDIASFKRINTTPKIAPWSWKGSIHRVYYNTVWSHMFNVKSLTIQCKKKNSWAADDVLAQAEIDMQTLATGPTYYEIPLQHPTDKYNICLVQFNLSMNEILYDVEFRLKNLNITDCYNRLLPVLHSNQTTVNVSCAYFDPEHTEWELQHFPLTINSLVSTDEENLATVNIRFFHVKLNEPIFANQFMKGSLHLVFWQNHPEQQGVTFEYGRVIIPLLGHYDTENRGNIPIRERVLWNTQVLQDHVHVFKTLDANMFEELNDRVQCTLNVSKGPSFIQLENGSYGNQTLIGNHFIGFPIPTQTEADQELQSVSVDKYVHEHCLCLKELAHRGYATIPDWYLHRQPSKELLRKYSYNPEGQEQQYPEPAKLDDNKEEDVMEESKSNRNRSTSRKKSGGGLIHVGSSRPSRIHSLKRNSRSERSLGHKTLVKSNNTTASSNNVTTKPVSVENASLVLQRKTLMQQKLDLFKTIKQIVIQGKQEFQDWKNYDWYLSREFSALKQQDEDIGHKTELFIVAKQQSEQEYRRKEWWLQLRLRANLDMYYQINQQLFSLPL